MYQPKYGYKSKHFVRQVAITPEMVRNNRNLRRFMLIRRLVYMLNLAITASVLMLVVGGVI